METELQNPFYYINKQLDNIKEAIENLNLKIGRSQTYVEMDVWFDLKSLCEYLPSKPSQQTVYGWTCNSEIPYHKIGKKLHFLKSEIDAWLKGGKHDTKQEIEQKASEYLKRNSQLHFN